MMKRLLIGICVLTLTACGDGGGGGTEPQVEPGPPPSGGSTQPPAPVQPSTPPSNFETADELIASISNVTVESPPVIEFQLTDGNGVAITDLTASDFRVTVVKLVPGTNGAPSAWQSYINSTEESNINPGNPPATQATSERGGELVNNGDGTYTYTMLTDITNVTDPVAVEYDPNLTHRVAMQFDNDEAPTNPTYDWVPATGATTGIETRAVVDKDSCNSCHDPLALHGGGRIETKYCVTCHNPGTTDADSGNVVDFKVMIHKIHRGANLPSVQAGGEYAIYGFRDSKHDYSNLHYPQDIRTCTKCHAGTGTDPSNGPTAANEPITVALTDDGDNWNEVPSRAACGSCHDDVNFEFHAGGQEDDTGCLNCHSEGGFVGSIASSHTTHVDDAIAEYAINVLSVTNTAPGQNPVVTFEVVDPLNGNAPYDIVNDLGRLRMAVAWDTDDYTNEGDGGAESTYETTDALANATDNGDGTYTLTAETQIPDPFIKASGGSGAIIFEGQGMVDVSDDPNNPQIEEVPLTFGIKYFSINETDGAADPRRQVVSMEKCNSCHRIKTQHGGNRANDTQGCVACHNPNLTDKSVRLLANNPPTDGKDEESIVFSRLIHGIHAAGFRENPLQVVGFRGFSTHVFDEEEVHYPGELSNCATCHVDGGWRLPLADGVKPATIDTGADLADRSDDVKITPIASACSSCHDDDAAQSHMEQNGGDFAFTTSSANSEACTVCHGEGSVADIDVMHEGLSD